MTNKANLRSLIEGYYDTQKLRIATGLRLVQAFKVDLQTMISEESDSDIPLTEGDLEQAEISKNLLKVIRADFNRISDAVVAHKRKFNFDDFVKDKNNRIQLISSRAQYGLVRSYEAHRENEELQLKDIEIELQNHPIYTEWLADVRGCGVLLSGVIVSYFDPEKAKYPSSFWRYAGLDVAADGRGRGRYTDHLIDRDYMAADGTVKTRKGLTYSPFVKTKIVGVLATSFLRVKGCEYRTMYDEYKNRIISEIESGERDKDSYTKAHINRMALRYMVKMFLKDLFINWRHIEGLPYVKSYAEQWLDSSAPRGIASPFDGRKIKTS